MNLAIREIEMRSTKEIRGEGREEEASSRKMQAAQVLKRGDHALRRVVELKRCLAALQENVDVLIRSLSDKISGGNALGGGKRRAQR